MNLIDTHCHIYTQEFDADRPDMISRAAAEGITKMLMPAIDVSTHVQMIDVEEQHPGQCLAMMGLHPCSIKENYREQMKTVEDHFARRPFVAVGETGLDYYWDLTWVHQQQQCFERQISLALEHDLPVVIHSRNSTDECISTVQRYQLGKLKGVFHCFSGSIEQARKIIDLGFHLGIGGVLTFKNAGLDAVVRQLEMEWMILETDAPYLAPVPFRGKRNECSYIVYVAKKLAEVKEMTLDQVAAATTANAGKLFGL